jgi:hypothetical protein
VHSLIRTEQHPALVGSLPPGAATRAFFYKTVFSYKKTVLVKSSARQTSNSLESFRQNVIHQNQLKKEGKCLMLFLTFWLLFGQAKSNKASRQLKPDGVGES